MRLTISAVLIAVAAAAAALSVSAADKPGAIPAYITDALGAAARKDDAANDERRKAAEVMAFAQVKPGQSVVELVPGSGYWTRIFSGIVGKNGHVYTIWPDEMMKYAAKSLANWQQLVKTPDYANVELERQPAAKLTVNEPVDLVFTSQNYHDYHDKFMGPVDMAAFNKQVFAALRPGGLYVIVDHVAPAGSGFSATDTTHRVDPAAVKQEVEAAGFKFDGESPALANPSDPHTNKVFDPSIRGKTDQFIFRFRKPAH